MRTLRLWIDDGQVESQFNKAVCKGDGGRSTEIIEFSMGDPQQFHLNSPRAFLRASTYSLRDMLPQLTQKFQRKIRHSVSTLYPPPILRYLP